jgi:hypothetical protein
MPGKMVIEWLPGIRYLFSPTTAQYVHWREHNFTMKFKTPAQTSIFIYII